MNKYLTSTVLLNAMYTEISEMGKMVQSTPCTTKASIEGISIPVNKEVSGFNHGKDSDGRVELGVLIKMINHDCASIRCTLHDGLRIATEAVKEDSEMGIYGMIWASNENANFRLNVLHPIVVQALLSGEYDHLIKLDSVGTLYVYTYSKQTQTKQDDKFAEEVIERWVEILTVLATEAYSPNTTLKCSTNMESLCQSIRQGSQNIESANVSFSESGNNPQKVITPLMFVTKGMLFPYYGAVISRHTSSRYESRDLMHWGSCNLDHRRDIGAWGSTCTGNLSNNVYASLRVLTNLNTGSPHHIDVISKRGDMKTYAKVSQEIAANLIAEHFKEQWGTVEVVAEPEKVVITEIEEETGAVSEVVVVKKRGRPSKSKR